MINLSPPWAKWPSNRPKADLAHQNLHSTLESSFRQTAYFANQVMVGSAFFQSSHARIRSKSMPVSFSAAESLTANSLKPEVKKERTSREYCHINDLDLLDQRESLARKLHDEDNDRASFSSEKHPVLKVPKCIANYVLEQLFSYHRYSEGSAPLGPGTSILVQSNTGEIKELKVPMLTPAGMCALCSYFRTKHDMDIHFIPSYDNAKKVIQVAYKDIQRQENKESGSGKPKFFIVQGRYHSKPVLGHVTPMVLTPNGELLIFDSLTSSKCHHYDRHIRDLLELVGHDLPRDGIRIKIGYQERQTDHVSCSLDALQILKDFAKNCKNNPKFLSSFARQDKFFATPDVLLKTSQLPLEKLYQTTRPEDPKIMVPKEYGQITLNLYKKNHRYDVCLNNWGKYEIKERNLMLIHRVEKYAFNRLPEYLFQRLLENSPHRMLYTFDENDIQNMLKLIVREGLARIPRHYKPGSACPQKPLGRSAVHVALAKLPRLHGSSFSDQ